MASNDNNKNYTGKRGGLGAWGIIIVSIVALVMVVILLAWVTNGWVDWKNPEKWCNSWGIAQAQPDDTQSGNDSDKDKDENITHTHTFDMTKYEYDSVNHWHASTCGHDIIRNMAAHTFNNNVCQVCGYEQQEPEQHVHTFDMTKIEYDSVNHWHAATCGHDVVCFVTAHIYENNICKVCGYKKQSELEQHVHTYDTSKWVYDEINHWHAATCGHEIITDSEAHIFVNGTCLVCGYKSQTEVFYFIDYDTLGSGSNLSLDVDYPAKTKSGDTVTVTVEMIDTDIEITRVVLNDFNTGEEVEELKLTAVSKTRFTTQFVMPAHDITLMFYLMPPV